MRKILESRKWWGHLVGLVAITANGLLGASADTVWALAGITAGYLGLQGLIDAVKERKAASEMPKEQ